MTRNLLAVIPLVALALASSGASSATGSETATHRSGVQIAVVGPTQGPVITYRLGSAAYPKGYHPACGASLNAYVIAPPLLNSFSFGGGIPATIGVGPCHAKRGDLMTARLLDIYGHIVFVSHPNPGNFTINDAGRDSHARLTITDVTTGHSVTKDVFYSY